MRIAVCRPQVPFARGGAEIFTDTLVDELRAARPRGGHRLRSVQVVSRRARSHAGVPLADARPRRGRRQQDRHGDRDEVPVVSRPPSGQARVARAPVPPGVRARPDRRSASSATRPRIGRCGGRCTISIASRSVRRRGSSRSRRTSRAGSPRSTGLAAEVLPHPPQELDYRCQGYGDFVLSVEPARPREADRPPHRGCGARARLRARDRRRRAGPRAARETGQRARPQRARSLRGPRLRERARGPVRDAASPSTTRRWTRTTGWCRSRPSSRRSPC